MVLDTLDPTRSRIQDGRVAETPEAYYAGRWQYIPANKLDRTAGDVLMEREVRAALIRLNPEIAQQPDRADEVIYQLRAILLSVNSYGLVRANEAFAGWLQGEHSMPFGLNNQHTPVRVIDFDNLSNNRFVVTNQFIFKAGPECRFDLVLLVNGIPMVIGEAKTPVRPAVSWVDGAVDILDNYEVNMPAMFVPNVFSFATQGKEFRFGSIRMPLKSGPPGATRKMMINRIRAFRQFRTRFRGCSSRE